MYIFTTKGLIYTVISTVIGLVFYSIFKTLNLKTIGVIILIIFALIGFVIGTCKVPEAGAIPVTKKIGGENIDEIIKRLIKFKMKKNRIYVVTKEEIKK